MSLLDWLAKIWLTILHSTDIFENTAILVLLVYLGNVKLIVGCLCAAGRHCEMGSSLARRGTLAVVSSALHLLGR